VFDDDNYKALKLVYDSINRRVAIFNLGVASGFPFVKTSFQPIHFTYQIDCGQWGYQSLLADVASASSDTYTGVVDGAEELNSFSNGVWPTTPTSR
jgi:hypothetical protein